MGRYMELFVGKEKTRFRNKVRIYLFEIESLPVFFSFIFFGSENVLNEKMCKSCFILQHASPV